MPFKKIVALAALACIFVANDMVWAQAPKGKKTGGPLQSNGDGTVSDSQTGLQWQQHDSKEELDWDGAVAYCNDLQLGKQSDWRLPDRDALKGLYAALEKHAQFAKDRQVKPLQWSAAYYWSASDANVPANAWFFTFSNGSLDSNEKTDFAYVRCVRGQAKAAKTATKP